MSVLKKPRKGWYGLDIHDKDDDDNDQIIPVMVVQKVVQWVKSVKMP